MPPVPPQPPYAAQQGTDQGEQESQPTANGDGDASATTSQPAPEYNLEQEREAILRMIAEGRVTPEEGDLLLEALGS